MFYDIPLDSSEDDADSDWDIIDPQYDVPQPPEETNQSSYNAPATSSPESEEDDQEQLAPRRKPGGYDSRIEQILYENPELPILITDAGKSLESGGRYIVYTIRTGVSSCEGFRAFHLADRTTRISRFADGIRSLPLFGTPSFDFTPP